MILVVDDDQAVLDHVRSGLEQAGYEVCATSSGEAALQVVAATEPALIISDIMMPEMDGFELKKQYASLFPARETPFIFLSSLSDPADIVRGLDADADDYLTKPVATPVLCAKVRSILRKHRPKGAATFHGDLARLPFVSLLRFCELSGLTGHVEITAASERSQIDFKRGEIQVDDLDLIDRLCDLTEGAFTVCSRAVSFAEIEYSARREESPPTLRSQPMGHLSGVRAGDRLFQVQTEMVAQPEPAVVTIVTVDGRTVSKESKPLASVTDRSAVEQQMRAQHREMESRVQERASSILSRKAQSPETERERYHRLFDEGYDCFREGRYRQALELWQEAEAIDPDSKALLVNLEVVKAKLAQQPQD